MHATTKNTNICMSQESHHYSHTYSQPHQKYSDIYIPTADLQSQHLASIKYTLIQLFSWTPRIAHQADHILPLQNISSQLARTIYTQLQRYSKSLRWIYVQCSTVMNNYACIVEIQHSINLAECMQVYAVFINLMQLLFMDMQIFKSSDKQYHLDQRNRCLIMQDTACEQLRVK